jgi:integration host factor subunit beta
MIKSRLIQKVHTKNPHLDRRDVERIVDALLDHITDTLADCGRVELRGFGVFGVKERTARIGRNPKTGQEVSVPGKKIPYFKMGKEIRTRLNKDRPAGPSANDNQRGEKLARGRGSGSSKQVP